MNDELVEKVAIAIHAASQEGRNCPWDDELGMTQAVWLNFARAAIAAVRGWDAVRPATFDYGISTWVVPPANAEADIPLTAFSSEEKDAFREQLPVPEADATVDRMYSDLGGCD